jgi:hypothetical protein
MKCNILITKLAHYPEIKDLPQMVRNSNTTIQHLMTTSRNNMSHLRLFMFFSIKLKPNVWFIKLSLIHLALHVSYDLHAKHTNEKKTMYPIETIFYKKEARTQSCWSWKDWEYIIFFVGFHCICRFIFQWRFILLDQAS